MPSSSCWRGTRWQAVADVRSAPYSRYTPHFNHDALSGLLADVGIDYLFLGGELGGRPADRSCYDADGRVIYDRVAETDGFDDGIRRIIRGADDRRIALLCSEKEPLECHRTLLVARCLAQRDVDLAHILADGRLESYDDALSRLLDIFKLPPQGDLFRARDEVIAEALHRQAQRVAYVGEKPAGRRRRRAVGECAVKVYTIGFTKKPASHFFETLRQSGAKRLVDVRLNNVSQLAGFAKKDDLAYFLRTRSARCSMSTGPNWRPRRSCWTPTARGIATGIPTSGSFWPCWRNGALPKCPSSVPSATPACCAARTRRSIATAGWSPSICNGIGAMWRLCTWSS